MAGGSGQCREQHIEALHRVQATDRHHHPGLLRQAEALAPVPETAPALRLRGVHKVCDVKDAPGRDPVLHQVVAKALGHGHEGLCVSIVLEVVIAAEARQVDRAGTALETRQAARAPEVGLDDRGGEAPQEARYPMTRQDVPSPQHRDLETGHGTAQGQSHGAAGGMDGMDRPGLGRERLHQPAVKALCPARPPASDEVCRGDHPKAPEGRKNRSRRRSATAPPVSAGSSPPGATTQAARAPQG